VNDLACGDTEIFKGRLIGKHFRELKSERYAGEVKKNLDMIRHFGQYRYETENVTRDGKSIPLEMKEQGQLNTTEKRGS